MKSALVTIPVTCRADVASSLEHRLRDLTLLNQAVWVYDFDHECVPWANAASLGVWQASNLKELQSRDLGKDVTDTVANRLRQYKADFERDESVQFREIWTLYPEGGPKTVEVIFNGFRLDCGRMAMLCEAVSDEKLEAESMRSAEALLHTSVMITLYSASGEPLYRNPAARSMVRKADEVLRDHFVSDATIRLLESASDDEIKVVANVHSANGQKWHDITARRCHDAVSGEHAWLISEVDVSRLKATEEHAQFLAEHDTLTGLANRNFVSVGFQNRIDQMLAKGETGALIFIDLDHFKDINDTLGHDSGDKLLIEVAGRLKTIVKEDESVARLGGDEFLLLLGPIKDSNYIQNVVKEMQELLCIPFALHGRDMSVTTSTGISVFPENGRQIGDLMRHADLAMYHAKGNGRNDFAFFSEDLSEAVVARINLESELVIAIKEEQFETYFQPRVDVQTNVITGAEALVRWNHPTKGLVPPDTFIPACEATGLISELCKFVLGQAVRAQCDWAKQGFDLLISVNLSPVQFGDDTLVEDLVNIVQENEGSPELLELEITESVLLGHDKQTIEKLNALVDHGFRIAIDDFGTGYSNLAYLHRYPIRCLKIDRSFIMQLETAKPIVELIVSMAKLFDFDVVAEGVETQQQLDSLRSYYCQEYQGYLFQRPIDFMSFTALLESQRILCA